MRNLQIISDKTAISLSIVCTIHCLLMPLVMIFLPSIAALPLEDEVFHLWMVFAVMPISTFALTLGYRKHKSTQILLVGIVGLIILICSAFLGHDILTEVEEKTFTVLASVLIAIGHFWNYRLCQHPNNCNCPDHNQP